MHAMLVRCARGRNGWDTRVLLNLPFLHRFDVLKAEDRRYFVGGALCGGKRELNDWSQAGALWVGDFSETLDKPLQVSPLLEGLGRNHGLCRIHGDGRDGVLVASDQGIHRVLTPADAGQAWSIERLSSRPASDVAVCDLFGDGEPLYLTIEPFHGDELVLSKLTGGMLHPIWRREIGFGHVCRSETLCGKPVFLFGERAGRQALYLLMAQNGRVIEERIDEGVGPVNAFVLHDDDGDTIIAANGRVGEVVAYRCAE